MGCCADKGCAPAPLNTRHRTVLYVALLLNATLFAIEFSMGRVARSTALQADGLDMLGDALVYGFSLFVLARPHRWQAWAALSKGLVMVFFALLVAGGIIEEICHLAMPQTHIMGGVAVAALVVNMACFAMLNASRHDNINMRSTWVCARNDMAANALVIVAAFVSAGLHSGWPDILVGGFICVLFAHSAYGILRESIKALGA